MPVDRPTFSESWYRVAELKPRLRSSVQVHRQHFRGQMWHVLQDPSNNQFFRLNEAAYRFVALLDGQRSVADTWKVCNEQLGDNAPTQGEAIQLMGQLYSSNLLQGELPPDSEGLFNRYRKRISREVRSYLMNVLFIRIPLFDPDRILEAWVNILGKVFTWYGMVLWVMLVSVGGYFAMGRYGDLVKQSENYFSQMNLAANLPMMYLSFAMIKAIHEFGHAFACKKFGKQTGSGGEVHIMGIMFMVFTPVPYVDASSSWAFRSKWHRIVVGAAGMIVEMAVAAVAAVVWANTPDKTSVHAFAYNIMFIGSVSTLMFNANPLLRYDGYYILSDLLEIPNLAQRSKDYIYYLVKKYVWGVKQARNPAHSRGERVWFVGYGIASTIYRTIVVVAILLFIGNRLFLLGAVLAMAAGVAWLLVPLGKFLHYLFTNNELMRVRGRAMGTTFGFAAVVIGFIGLIPMPDRLRVEGVVEPTDMRVVYARSEGFVKNVWPTCTPVQANVSVVIDAENRSMTAEKAIAESRMADLEARKNLYQSRGEMAAMQAMEMAIQGQNKHLREINRRLDDLQLKAPISGLWVCPQGDRLAHTYLEPQNQVGVIISDQMLIRAMASQDMAPRIIAELKDHSGQQNVEIRVKGRPELLLDGSVIAILPAGTTNLPSAALALTAGGAVATDPKDEKGVKAAEEVFEIRVAPGKAVDSAQDVRLLTGQRVVVRINLPEKPLVLQWKRSILQLIQQKLQT